MKKLISVALLAVMLLGILSACKNKDNGVASSNITSSDAAYSEVSTQSETSSKENVSSKEESKKPAESTPSKVENVSKAETSSKVEEVSSKADVQNTVSTNIIQTVGPSKFIEIGVYHFEPHWTTHYGTDEDSRFKEFEDVVSQGYFNSVICSGTYFGHKRFWEIVKKYDLKVWLSCYSYYDSEKIDKSGNPVVTTIDTWVKNTAEKHVAKIRNDQEKFKYFQGFFFDEPILRGQSNRDFLTMTEALYKKYGRRIHVCESINIFRNWNSTADDFDMDFELTVEYRNAMTPKSKPFGNTKAFKYVTDIGLDAYNFDVREGTKTTQELQKYMDAFPEIKSGADYYKLMFNFMKKALGDSKNIWHWPCSFTTSIYTELNNYRDPNDPKKMLRANEDYCLAHLQFFKDLLLEHKYQGGLYLYNYYDADAETKPFEKGLVSHLVVRDKYGNQLLQPSETKWSLYSRTLQSICEEFRNTKANQVMY